MGSTARDIDAVIAGHICLDLIPIFTGTVGEMGDFLVPGALQRVGPLTTATGGAVANTGLAMKRLGARVELMGKVGSDAVGQMILKLLSDFNARGGMIAVPRENSSYTVVISPPGVDRMFLHFPGANDTFGLGDVRMDLVKRARVFHLGYPPHMRRLWEKDGEQLAAIFKRAKEMGATTSLDMVMPDPQGPSSRIDWRAILERTLPHVDLFLPSASETLLMLDRERFDECGMDEIPPSVVAELASECLAMGAGGAMIKCGEQGLCLRTAGRERLARFGAAAPGEDWIGRDLWMPGLRVDHVVGATGAGDAAIAGFLTSLLRGQPLVECLRTASAVGACNVTAPDALSGVLGWDETQAKLRAGWPELELNFDKSAWTWDEENRIWRGPQDAHAPSSHMTS